MMNSSVRPPALAMLPLSLLLIGCGAGTDRTGDTGSAAAVETPPATPAPAPAAMATARILEPAEGAELPAGPVRIVLAADNIQIVPAGDERPNSGHHHLFLNTPITAQGEPIPAGVEGVVHLGQAQSEYTFENLPPGEYTLVAVIGDLVHRVIPQATDTVRFRVRAP
jgi:hypothetical protein